MKKSTDPRHQRRVRIVQALFANSFHEEGKGTGDPDCTAVLAVAPPIDTMIEEAAPQFPIDKIAKVDVAILRLAVYELLFEKKEPPKVIIDEAVELAKELGGDGSPSFVNGVLGTLFKKHYEQQPEENTNDSV